MCFAGTDVFTMFRDPVDQVVSQYFYLHHKRALLEPAYKLNGMKFPETMDQYLDNPIHLNNQLAFLVGKYRMKPGNDVTLADLDAAKEMLIQLNVHPGLTERFAESLHIFETITGRRVPGGQILNLNQNPDRLPLEAISARTKDRIRELSELDNVLYAFARDLFMKDVALCGKTRQYTFVDTAKPALTYQPGSNEPNPYWAAQLVSGVVQPIPFNFVAALSLRCVVLAIRREDIQNLALLQRRRLMFHAARHQKAVAGLRLELPARVFEDDMPAHDINHLLMRMAMLHPHPALLHAMPHQHHAGAERHHLPPHTRLRFCHRPVIRRHYFDPS